METLKIIYPSEDRLQELLQLTKSDGKTHEIGTAFLPAGCSMPETGVSQHAKHEVSIILEGCIETTSGGSTATLKAGDIVSIPETQSQSTKVLENTRLIYIFFDK